MHGTQIKEVLRKMEHFNTFQQRKTSQRRLILHLEKTKQGSETKNGVVSAIICSEMEASWCLPKYITIFKVEAFAILQVLQFCNTSNFRKIVIASDFLSRLTSLQNCFSQNPLITRIENKIAYLRWKTKHCLLSGYRLI